MPYTVSFTARADRDVAIILDWLYRRSPEGAGRWLDALEAAQGRLAEDPLRYPLAEEWESFPGPVSELLFRTKAGATYRLLFSVDNNDVRIMSVRGPGQKLVKRRDTRL